MGLQDVFFPAGVLGRCMDNDRLRWNDTVSQLPNHRIVCKTDLTLTSMSEETHNAAELGPLAIQVAVLVSGIMGWLLTISLCFCVTNLEDILATPTGVPAAQIFLNAGGKTGGTVMVGLTVLVQFFTGCSSMLANTRMAYAFARDDALPFSR